MGKSHKFQKHDDYDYDYDRQKNKKLRDRRNQKRMKNAIKTKDMNYFFEEDSE